MKAVNQATEPSRRCAVLIALIARLLLSSGTSLNDAPPDICDSTDSTTAAAPQRPWFVSRWPLPHWILDR